MARIVLILISAFLLCGCDRSAPDTQPTATRPVADAPDTIAWQRINDALVVAVDDDDTRALVAAATAEARRTLDDARQRWTIADADDRVLWAIKWSAPLANSESAGERGDDRTEHVWVQPINWSAFRIEGRLLSTPVQPLECGRHAGEVVSLNVEEVSDWIHFAADPATSPDVAFEGGFTVKALEQKFGRAK